MASHLILSKEIAYRKLQRMAYEIMEQNVNEKEIILAGIKENGSIKLDKKNPKNISLSKEINFDNKIIIVTDDVANSGKTLLYALKPFLEFYPKKIQTLVLVERSYKEFPVAPDYVGLSLSTAFTEKIIVETNNNEVEGASLITE